MRYNTQHFIVVLITASGRSSSHNLPLVQEIEHDEQTPAEKDGTYKFSQICHENRLKREPALKNGLNRSLMQQLVLKPWHGWRYLTVALHHSTAVNSDRLVCGVRPQRQGRIRHEIQMKEIKTYRDILCLVSINCATVRMATIITKQSLTS